MAFSNLSIMLTPVLFGFVSGIMGTEIFPVFLAVMFVLMAGCTIILRIGDARSHKNGTMLQSESPSYPGNIL